MGGDVSDRESLQGVAGGLLLMAVFTALWAGWAYGSWGGWWIVLTVAFWGVAIYFAVMGIRYLRRAAALPPKTSGPDRGRWFTVIFAAESLLIAAACGGLGGSGHFQFICPAIALVVGLHFIPLALVFERRVDIVMGLVAAGCAVAGLVAVGRAPSDYATPWGAVAYAMACVTSCYGAVMLHAVQRTAHAAD